MSIGRLHVILDARSHSDDLLAEVLGAGAPVVQLRVKDMDDRARYEATAPLVERCHEAGSTCVVNDRADMAMATGADGWHGGADDLPVSVARRLLGPDAIVGGTARDPETARQLEAAGASYLGVGPVYPSTTKVGLPDPIGLEGLARVAHAVVIPVIAISGITSERVPEVLATGAHGVAVVGAVRDFPDPALAVRGLLEALGSSHG